MQISFRKAEKKRSKLRLALIAPSGFGKTYSALRIATGLGGKIAMIDTEAGSGDLYGQSFEYDIVTMNPPYSPEKYIVAIKAAEDAGYETVIVDSLTHAWAGEGGLLEKHGTISNKTGNSWSAWRDVTPEHNKLMDAILGSKSHIITTLRAKTDWIVGEDKRPVKVGLAPIQREGVEYIMSLVFELDKDHKGYASKDRTGIFDGKITELTEDVGKKLNEWLNYAQEEKPEGTKIRKTDSSQTVQETGKGKVNLSMAM